MGPDRNSCFKLGREGEAMAMVCKFPFSYHVTRVDFGQLLHFSPYFVIHQQRVSSK